MKIVHDTQSKAASHKNNLKKFLLPHLSVKLS